MHPSTLERALLKQRLGILGSVFAPPASSLFPSVLESPDLLGLLLGPSREHFHQSCLSVSLFQFDGESAYVGMSDGNPELLSTSQVGAQPPLGCCS